MYAVKILNEEKWKLSRNQKLSHRPIFVIVTIVSSLVTAYDTVSLSKEKTSQRATIEKETIEESENRKRSARISSQPRTSVAKANARNLGIILPWLFMQMGARRLNIWLSVVGARRTLVDRTFSHGKQFKKHGSRDWLARPRFFENANERSSPLAGRAPSRYVEKIASFPLSRAFVPIAREISVNLTIL